MKEKESIPFAPHLIESMRSLGYSFETAIADIIDNSISANAKRVDLFLTPDIDPKLIIFDDGCGMSCEELEEAMRYGAKNPNEKREEHDLGRFGLGLKSASLSQCRKMIVVSKKENIMSAFSWDLDYIVDKKGWLLLEYDTNEMSKLPMLSLFDNVKSGTYILLQHFDRVSSSTANLSTTLNSFMNRMIDHVSLVFHRFLNNGVDIYVNNNLLTPRDPFLTNHRGTSNLRSQTFMIEGATINVKPYILPYINKLSHEDIFKAGGKDDLKNNQGFYIYRNKRLIIWGTWFRLTRKDELSKLARVMVDIPSDLDYMWNIDIKKSSASLPDVIKKNLYACIEESVFRSKSVHEYRGRKVNSKEINHVWERIELRDGCYEYRINNKIPQLQILEASLNNEQNKMLANIINTIEKSFPTTSLYIDKSKGITNEVDQKFNIEELEYDIKQQLIYCENSGLDKKKILKLLLSTEPYSNCEELKEKFTKELINEMEYV